jgi:hypothetical protein
MCLHKWKELMTVNGWLETIEVIYECTKCGKWKFVYENISERSDLLLLRFTKELLEQK